MKYDDHIRGMKMIMNMKQYEYSTPWSVSYGAVPRCKGSWLCRPEILWYTLPQYLHTHGALELILKLKTFLYYKSEQL